MDKNFVVYSSSAGSGKTYTLVREYLRLALATDDPMNFRRILAMTFTNKAANEMKERVITTLKSLSAGPESESFDPTLVTYLADNNKTTAEIVQQRATQTLQHILHNYSDLSISTIDKFTHKVIRTFARDLDLPSDFEVYMDTDELLMRTVDSLIMGAGQNAELTEVLLDFAYHKSDSDKSWKVETDVFEFSKNLLKEDAEVFLESLRGYSLAELGAIRKTLERNIDQFEQPLIKIGQQALQALRNAGISYDALKGGRNGLGRYFAYLAENRQDKFMPSATNAKNFEGNDWHAGKASPHEQDAIEAVRPELYQLYKEAITKIDAEYPSYRVQKMICRQFYAVSLIHELEAAIKDLKEDQNLLLIADFNKKISEVIRSEPVPFIYERLGERYHHFLLDEFQDTSLQQWHNLVPLVENSLAGNHFNLIVGDGKQSIYRWRNGEVEQFIALPELYQAKGSLVEKEAIFERNFEKQQLNRNWRSRQEVVSFNNDLFQALAPKLLNEHFLKVYEDMAQHYAENETGGYVCVEFLDKDSATDEHYLKSVLGRINEVLADGYEHRDIAVICRTNGKASLVANYLLQHQIPVISSESLLVGSNEEVKLLLGVLRHLTNFADQSARLDIIRYWKPDDFKTGRLFSYVDDATPLQVNIAGFLNDYNIKLRYAAMQEIPVYDLVEELTRIFELDVKANPYLLFFLDVTHQFASRESKNTIDFLDWWTEHRDKVSIKVPAHTNAVELLTIHKSKGLQFPVVIVPFANWPMKKGNDSLWVSPKGLDQEVPAALIYASQEMKGTAFNEVYETEQAKTNLDHLNMLYVAFTRPEDRLYVISDQRKGIDNVRHFLLEALKTHEGYREDIFTQGSRTPAQVKRPDDSQTAYKLESSPSYRWKEKLLLSLRAPSVWNMDDPEAATRFGNLIHTALAAMESQSDIERVVLQMQLSGLVDASQREELEAELNELFKLEQMRNWYDPRNMAFVEHEILCADGTIIRPDRVVMKAGQVEVVDFKTGKESPNHVSQIESYAKALSDIGYDRVKKFLVYTSERKIVEV